MLDIKIIRENPEKIQSLCHERGMDVDITSLLAVDSRKLKILKEIESLRAESNQISGLMRDASPEERASIKLKGSQLKKEIKIANDLLTRLESEYSSLMKQVPNLYADDTPLGFEELSNVELEVFGSKPEYSFEPKDHIELGEKLGMDFDAASRVAGSGFPMLKGNLALLENALLRFVQDQAINAGFVPHNVPLLARHEILEGLGFNPRRSDEGTEIFSTIQDDLCLAGTAEISLVGQFAEQTLDSSALPIKIVAMTPCFRREGAYGRRDAGLYRNKMFNKVELVTLSTESDSTDLLEDIRKFEIDVFKQIGIYFRVIRICAGDLGAPAYKKYDLEGWMLGRGDENNNAGWGELTSCSNCTDYQSRRLKIRHKSGSNKPSFVHTLNGTGVTSRALITILEQFQNEDGSVNVPEVLQPYMRGIARID